MVQITDIFTKVLETWFINGNCYTTKYIRFQNKLPNDMWYIDDCCFSWKLYPRKEIQRFYRVTWMHKIWRKLTQFKRTCICTLYLARLHMISALNKRNINYNLTLRQQLLLPQQLVNNDWLAESEGVGLGALETAGFTFFNALARGISTSTNSRSFKVFIWHYIYQCVKNITVLHFHIAINKSQNIRLKF